MCLFILRFYCSGGMHTRFGLGECAISLQYKCINTEYFQSCENTECVQTSRDTYLFKVVGILNFQLTLLD